MTTFIDVLTRRGGGPRVPAHDHGADEISGEAVFATLKVDSLLAGTIDSKEIIVSGGADGVIRSDNFATGTAGWAIFGDGNAEFNNVTIRGDVFGNWDGGTDLSGGADGSATTGYFLDSSVGAAQFEGSIYVGGNLELTGSGAIRTAASGQRIEMSGATKDRINFYTGSGAETAPGFISVAPTLFQLQAPNGFGLAQGGISWDTTAMRFYSGDQVYIFQDDSLGNTTVTLEAGPSGSAKLNVSSWTLQAAPLGGIGFSKLGTQTLSIGEDYLNMGTGATGQAAIRRAVGSDATPAYSFAGDLDTGPYRIAANHYGIAVGGARALSIASDFVRFGDASSNIAAIKQTAGTEGAPSYVFAGAGSTGWWRRTAGSGGMAGSADGSSLIIIAGTTIAPGSDNTINLGSSGLRFIDVWAVDTTINSSDPTHKKYMNRLAEKVNVGLLIDTISPVQFKWKKGGTRWHWSFDAADVRDGLKRAGLDPAEFGVFIDPSHDDSSQWPDGNPNPGLHLRPGELQPIIWSELQSLRKRVAALESRPDEERLEEAA